MSLASWLETGDKPEFADDVAPSTADLGVEMIVITGDVEECTANTSFLGFIIPPFLLLLCPAIDGGVFFAGDKMAAGAL